MANIADYVAGWLYEFIPQVLWTERHRQYQVLKDLDQVLKDVSRVAEMADSGFIPGDSHETSFKLGQKSIILHMRQMMNLSESDLSNFITKIETETNNDD